MLRATVTIHTALVHATGCLRRRSDAGQTTAEYALVLLGAAAIALLVLAWATKTNRISKLLDVVMEEIMGRAS